jgi:hypothetical protein
MGKEVSRTITAGISDVGAALKVSFDAAEITAEMKASLEKRLLKKGVAVRWSGEEKDSELFVRIVEMNQGNQLLRYLLPFIAPAYVEVEGRRAIAGSSPQPLHYLQRAQVGLLGGSAKSMLKVCTQRIADKIAGEVLSGLKP